MSACCRSPLVFRQAPAVAAGELVASLHQSRVVAPGPGRTAVLPFHGPAPMVLAAGLMLMGPLFGPGMDRRLAAAIACAGEAGGRAGIRGAARSWLLLPRPVPANRCLMLFLPGCAGSRPAGFGEVDVEVLRRNGRRSCAHAQSEPVYDTAPRRTGPDSAIGGGAGLRALACDDWTCHAQPWRWHPTTPARAACAGLPWRAPLGVEAGRTVIGLCRAQAWRGDVVDSRAHTAVLPYLRNDPAPRAADEAEQVALLPAISRSSRPACDCRGRSLRATCCWCRTTAQDLVP